MENRPHAKIGMVSAFNRACIGGKGDKAATEALAEAQGWMPAENNQLKAGGLSALRKQVLRVPGGGARVSETQSIFAAIGAEQLIFLNLEERFIAGKHATTTCAIYQRVEDILPVCSEVGRIVNRAPDSNRRYKNTGSHFLSWKTRIGEKPASIQCQKAPKATILPYEGVSLVLKVDHSGLQTRKRVAANTRKPQHHER